MIKKSNAGLGLMEVIIAAALVGGIGVAVMQIQKNATETLVTAETGSEITAILSEVRALLSNAATCKATLGGKNASNTAEGTINEITFVKSDGTETPRYQVSDEKRYGQGRIKILGYRLSDSASDVDVASTNTTHLFIRMYRSKMSTNQESTKRIKMWVDVDGGGNIVECRALSASENSIWTRNDTNQNNIYYENGNVGIGVSDPKSQLHLKDGSLKLENGLINFNDIGSWAGTANQERQWFGVCKKDTPCDTGWSGGDSLHLSGISNEIWGKINSGADNRRVLSLQDDIAIPHEGRLWVGIDDKQKIIDGYDFMGVKSYPRLYIRTANEYDGHDGSPDLLFDDMWTNIIGTGRVHISGERHAGVVNDDGTNTDGRVFLNPWNMSGDVLVGHGDASKHNLYVNGKILVNQSGYMATPPSENLHVIGDAEVTGSITYGTAIQQSDMRFKKEIKQIQNPLSLVEKIEGVTYYFRNEEFPNRNFQEKRQFGVIAQDLEKVLPDLVHEDDEGYKGVEYTKLTPLLIEAVKELKNEVNQLKKEIAKLKKAK